MGLSRLTFPRPDAVSVPDAFGRTRAEANRVAAAMPQATEKATATYWTWVKDELKTRFPAEQLLPRRLPEDQSRVQLRMELALPASLISLHPLKATPDELATVTTAAQNNVVEHLKTQFRSYDSVDVQLVKRPLVAEREHTTVAANMKLDLRDAGHIDTIEIVLTWRP